MKKIKKLNVFSDGSCYFDYSTATSIKISHVDFQKNDYKNFIFYTKKKVTDLESSYSKNYKKKFFL